MRLLGCISLGLVLSVGGFAADNRNTDGRNTDGKMNDSRVADAVQNGDTVTLRALIDQKAIGEKAIGQKTNLNATQLDGSTALLWAAQNDDIEAAKLLLSAGADAKIANRYGVAPLSEAAINGDAVMIEMLLKAGADANTTLPAGDNVLMLAAKTGKADAVKVLIDHGAKVNAKEDWHGETALMIAAGENHAEVVKLLIERGADTNAIASNIEIPKMKTGPAQVFSVYPVGGLTALMQAARNNSFDATRALIDGKANLNQKDPHGMSATMIAILNGHWDLAKMLVNLGADPNDGSLPLAADIRNLVFLRPAQDRVESSTALDVVKELLAKGAKADSVLPGPVPVLHNFGTNVTGPVDAPPLYRAAKAADIEVMRLLIEHGANVTLKLKDDSTALHSAVGIGVRPPMGDAALTGPTPAEMVKAINFLLYYGADINAPDATGRTPLHGAAGKGADELVQFLADRGANLSAKDKRERTALDVANADPGKGSTKGEGGFGAVAKKQPTTVALLRKLMGMPAEDPALTAKDVPSEAVQVAPPDPELDKAESDKDGSAAK